MVLILSVSFADCLVSADVLKKPFRDNLVPIMYLFLIFPPSDLSQACPYKYFQTPFRLRPNTYKGETVSLFDFSSFLSSSSSSIYIPYFFFFDHPFIPPPPLLPSSTTTIINDGLEISSRRRYDSRYGRPGRPRCHH